MKRKLLPRRDLKLKSVMVYMPAKLRKAVGLRARQEGRSLSNLLNRLTMEGMRNWAATQDPPVDLGGEEEDEDE